MDIGALVHMGRFRKLATTLLRYGFGDVVDRLDLPARLLMRPESSPHCDKNTFERIRLAMEELGPTFIKFGQILSLRTDLLPPELILELRRLQTRAAPVDGDEIIAVVEEEMDGPLEMHFSAFDCLPLASASLAQVHRAVLNETGQAVAVKVRKPGIARVLEQDLGILEAVAQALDGRFELLRSYDLPGTVRELKQMLMNEVDFNREARNMRIARANLRDMEGLRIPELVSGLCTERMITMELLPGRVLSDVDPADVPDPHALAVTGIQAAVRQILGDGFFHADPHPGNIMLLPDGTLGYLDWGMVGRLAVSTRSDLLDFIAAVADRDSERVVAVLLKTTDAKAVRHPAPLERDILDILDGYTSLGLEEINVGRMLMEMTHVVRRHDIRIPPDLAVMNKALLTAQGTARLFDPRLNVIAEAEPFVRSLVRKRYAPRSMFETLRRMGQAIFSLHRTLPRRLESVFGKLEHGELAIRFRHENLDGLIDSLENASNRLSLAIVLAAMFVGSSMIIATDLEPKILGVPALGVIGYFISGLLGLWLAFIIIRRRRF